MRQLKRLTALTSPPEPEKKKDPADDDILEFTSATEGEASSSAWELVPEKKIARKKGVNFDSELDHMVKKTVKEEAEQQQLASQAQVTSAAVTTSSGASSTTAKDVVTPIPEDPAAEAAEEEGDKAEAEAAEKAITSAWQEADFSLEDAPTPPSKDVLTTSMGRKNLMVAAVTPEDDDSEMPDVEEAVASHLGSSAKRKGRSTSQGAAKKRALPLKSPRAASAGPKSKSPHVQKPVNKIPRASSPLSAKAVGKPLAKAPPKSVTSIVPLAKAAAAKSPPATITPLDKAAPAKPPPAAVTSKPPPSKEAWKDWQTAKAKVAEREQKQNLAQPKSPPLFAVDWSRFTSKEAFLAKTGEVYRLDPNSAEGYNHHVSSYYYVSTDWGVSHPQSYSSIMLKNDSRQSHR